MRTGFGAGMQLGEGELPGGAGVVTDILGGTPSGVGLNCLDC